VSSLRERRIALGLTQAELAEMVGLNRATIMKWERKPPAPNRLVGLPRLRWLRLHDVLRELERKAS
jgi:transcriptional regulator with XRE-family HTH domain